MAPPTIFENIPADLRNCPQWVLHIDKVPYCVISEGKADVTDRGDLESYRLARERYERSGKYSGLGFAFTPIDEFAGLDLDDVRNADTGELKPWAVQLIVEANSYAEVSPSGTGVKIFGRGVWKGQRGGKQELCDGSAIECYDRGRHFCVTGRRLDYAPAGINNIQNVLDDLYARYFASRESIDEVLTSEQLAALARKVLGVDRNKLLERCLRYVSKMAPAVQGHDGSGRAFAVACTCFKFALTQAEALLVFQEYNKRCVPPWDCWEIDHKLEDAEQRVKKEGSFGTCI